MNGILRFLATGFILIFSLSTFGADGSAPAGRFNFRQKLEKKETSRWTLQEWLAQKERNQLMDLWLAMYSPSPYEFFIGGAHQSYKSSTDPETSEKESHQSTSGHVGAYATVIGLEGFHEYNSEEDYTDTAGSLNLRIIGNAVQGTHLNLFYGLRNRTIESNGTDIILRNQFAGGDLNLYVTRYFGIQGNYKHYLADDDSALGSVTGSRLEAGVFIDFAAVRIFGNYFSDRQVQELLSIKSTTERTGIQSGLLFFF